MKGIRKWQDQKVDFNQGQSRPRSRQGSFFGAASLVSPSSSLRGVSAPGNVGSGLDRILTERSSQRNDDILIVVPFNRSEIQEKRTGRLVRIEN